MSDDDALTLHHERTCPTRQLPYTERKRGVPPCACPPGARFCINGSVDDGHGHGLDDECLAD